MRLTFGRVVDLVRAVPPRNLLTICACAFRCRFSVPSGDITSHLLFCVRVVRSVPRLEESMAHQQIAGSDQG